MANTINNKRIKNERDGMPLWFSVLFSIAALFFLSSIGLYAYQKNNQSNQNFQQQSETYIKKLGILEQKDVIDANWLHTLNPLVKNVQGRLLWSSNKQQGVMEFVNLPRLKKNQEYLLWITDFSSGNSKPVLAIIDSNAIFKKKKKTIMLFKGANFIKQPFKFELMLKFKSGEEQPLLLAQP